MATDKNAIDDWFRHEVLATVAPPACSEPVVFYHRYALRRAPMRRVNERDVLEAGLHAALGASAAFLSTQVWPAACRLTSRARRAHHLSRRYPAFRKALRRVLGDVPDQEAVRLFDSFRARLHERRMVYLRERVRPGPVRFRYDGLEHLQGSLAAGRGAVLWASPFMFESVTGKRSLAEAGIHAHQVSVTEHGFSRTRFGVAWLNPALVRVENSHLAGRLVFEREQAISVTRRAVRLLRGGAPVLFANNNYAGSAFLQLPIGVAGHTNMATAPINMALKGGSALHVVTTLEREPFREYETIISPDLAAPERGREGAGDPPLAATARVALAARDELFARITADPDQFMGWGGVHGARVPYDA